MQGRDLGVCGMIILKYILKEIGYKYVERMSTW
jgi:hypothetical protein